MRITKPNRATHTYRLTLRAAPDKVFPLLCPVRETEWADGWLPDLVISSSGVAERDCVFITPDKLGKAIWYITRHEPERWFVEMLKILPGVTACRLEIQLSENGDGCFADVTYSHTSIGSAGDEFVAKFTADYYQRFMQAWENELNHFFKTGSRRNNPLQTSTKKQKENEHEQSSRNRVRLTRRCHGGPRRRRGL